MEEIHGKDEVSKDPDMKFVGQTIAIVQRSLRQRSSICEYNAFGHTVRVERIPDHGECEKSLKLRSIKALSSNPKTSNYTISLRLLSHIKSWGILHARWQIAWLLHSSA